ncbi:hypothetical protein BIW11_07897 [Tropilaelaps mercedesae]|uniref:Uncharacterized protein n=1 Tax=Tropilaelaps mercedesae TaxID=418985 RepID=A0A1V9XRX3_9ACAR|nr:hypothetical protein BIW11_07897 [Tropilaelaps mercedesae]
MSLNKYLCNPSRAVPPQSGDPIASPGGASPKRHAQIYALHPTVTSNAPVIKEISIPVAKAISSTEIVIELLDFKRYSRPSNPFLPGSNIPKNKNSDNTANVDDNILKSGDSRPQLRAGVAKGSGSVDNRSTLKSEQSGPRVVMKARSIRVRDQALRKGEYNLTVDVLHDSSDADRRAAGRAEKPTTQSREVAESSRKKKGRRKGSRTRATKENSVKKTSSSSDEDSSSSEAPLYLPMASTQDDTFPSTKLDRNRVLQCLNKIFKTLPDTSPKTMTVLPKAPRQRKK